MLLVEAPPPTTLVLVSSYGCKLGPIMCGVSMLVVGDMGEAAPLGAYACNALAAS